MRILIFALLALAIAFGIDFALAIASGVNFAVLEIPHFLGPKWIHFLNEYAFVLTLLVPAVAIAVLAYAMGLWRGGDATAICALILCVVVPLVARVLFYYFALFVLHASVL